MCIFNYSLQMTGNGMQSFDCIPTDGGGWFNDNLDFSAALAESRDTIQDS